MVMWLWRLNREILTAICTAVALPRTLPPVLASARTEYCHTSSHILNTEVTQLENKRDLQNIVE